MINNTDDSHTRVPRYLPALFVTGAIIAFLSAALISLPVLELKDILLPAIVLSVVNILSFFYCGGFFVTASSVASYGIFMFVGYPAIYAALGFYDRPQTVSPNSFLVVITLGFLAQVMMISSLRGPKNEPKKDARPESTLMQGTDTRVFWLSFITFSLSVVLNVLGFSHIASGFSWTALIGAAVLTFCKGRKTIYMRGLLLLITIVVVETGFSFGGFGRLNLAVLAISVVVVASLGLRTLLVKIGTVVLTGPALMFLVNQRLAFLEDQRGISVNDSEGIGSVVGPFQSAAAIVDATTRGELSLDWGLTVVKAALIWIPRALWEDKPVGFGREIVAVTQPNLLGSSTFSDAGTFIGEAVWNFGTWGALIFFVGMAILVRLLDRRLVLFAGQQLDFRAALTLMLTALLSATLLNLVWGSTSTVASRTLLPFVLLVVLFSLTRPEKPSNNFCRSAVAAEVSN